MLFTKKRTERNFNTSLIKKKIRKNSTTQKESFFNLFKKDLKKNKNLYIMLIPVILYYLIFHYQPMYGVQIAFKNYSFRKGILGSDWVGLTHIKSFFNSYYFVRLLRNTLTLSVNDLIWGFPAPIILALLINEIRGNRFKRLAQSITYLPHFISLVVVCGMIKDFFSINGLVNNVITHFGGQAINFFALGKYFAPIYVGTNIWQQLGWSTIIYLAALTAIDPELYEAAKIDGANKFKQILHITLPCIMGTIIILFILRTGKMLNVGSEKVLLLYNSTIYEKADIISTFVYRKGLEESNYSYAAAVGLFNSVINFILLISVNKLSKKFSDSSLW
ncbi:ABC transporter permease subunit [Clostridium sediminicola]|uniref:ABC transporter permease n=1 Tax=Clostridium sediminicola TaxID=3114879 RepID=UPI0031F2122C